ncbi:peptidoglycan DD-metalloendopeptidase family protein [Pannus brasiliensis CCIBt3594]|uniref:Peptidoglycan DD-metalloendopeptidase family protein n=1 Tax=Pannus brasiliensis CCIBt3594 TaxID=1427578 RepID=A0AAW9QRI9_9CHRO
MSELKKLIENKGTIDLGTNHDPAFVRELQELLERKGYELGTVDGILGTRTRSAWGRFKKDHYLDRPEAVGASSLSILLEMPDRTAGFSLPTKGIGWISSPFGPRARGMHRGIDIAADTGTPVYAVADGTVTTAVCNCRVGNFSCGGGYGNVVYISHPAEGFETRSAHLSRVDVAPGAQVRKGQKIGEVGDTGHSFGPHLHFEIRVRGEAIDPIRKINPIV